MVKKVKGGLGLEGNNVIHSDIGGGLTEDVHSHFLQILFQFFSVYKLHFLFHL